MKSYFKKGGIAIVDQVLFSGSNFLLNLFLVKLLTPSEYGLFGSLYSLYLLVCISFIAIFLEPYIYYKNTDTGIVDYTSLYAGFVNSLLIIALGITLIGYLSGQYSFVYISYALSTCIIYFYKRHYVSILTPKYSLYISINYFVLVAMGLLVLNYVIPKNLFNAFFVLNAASVLSVLPTILINEQFRTAMYTRVGIQQFLKIMQSQKRYSFHCLSSGLLSWIPNNIYFLILPMLYSKEVNALFKALQNISLPITHLNIAIVSLLVPIFIKSVNPDKLIKQISYLFAVMPVGYLVLILILRASIEHYIYNDKYTLQPILIIALLVGIIPEIIANIYKAYFRSIEKPELVTRINFLNAVVAISCIYLVFKLGLVGVLISYVTVNVFNLGFSFYLYEINKKEREKTLCGVA